MTLKNLDVSYTPSTTNIETNAPRTLLSRLSPNEETLNFLQSLLEAATRSERVKQAIEQIQDKDYGFFFSSRTATLLNQPNTLADFDETLLEAVAPYYILATELLSSKGLPDQARIEAQLSALAEEPDLDEVGTFLRKFGEESELSGLRFPSFRNRVSDAKNDMLAVISEADDVFSEINNLGSTEEPDVAQRRLCKKRPRLCNILVLVIVVIIIIL